MIDMITAKRRAKEEGITLPRNPVWTTLIGENLTQFSFPNNFLPISTVPQITHIRINEIGRYVEYLEFVRIDPPAKAFERIFTEYVSGANILLEHAERKWRLSKRMQCFHFAGKPYTENKVESGEIFTLGSEIYSVVESYIGNGALSVFSAQVMNVEKIIP